MHRRLTAALGVSVVLLAAAAPAATAATYPPSDNSVSVDGGATDIAIGDQVDFNARTFEPGSDVTFTVSGSSSSLGSVRGAAVVVPAASSGTCGSGASCVRVADSEGVATASVTFSASGKQTVTATGVAPDGNDLSVSATVTVAGDAGGASSDPPGGLAKTGTDLIRFGVIGLALVAMGALLVVAVRRRSGPDPV